MGGSQDTLGSSTLHTLPYKNSSAVIGNFARINSGRFRPIHPAPSLDKISSLNNKNSSVVRKGPIRKDGSIVLSPPKHSPALSQQSGSSDKENTGNPNIWIRPEEEEWDNNVFIEKEPESVCSEVSRVSQLHPRSEKKVSFTPLMTTVHDVTREEGENDMSRQSLDTIDDPDGFIDGAEDLLNLDQIDLHQKISVVGNQVNDTHDTPYPYTYSRCLTFNICDLQEVYNDPRSRIQKQNQSKKSTNGSDGSNLSFKDKLKMFTHK